MKGVQVKLNSRDSLSCSDLPVLIIAGYCMKEYSKLLAKVRVRVAQTKRMTTKLQLLLRLNAASLVTNLTTTTQSQMV